MGHNGFFVAGLKQREAVRMEEKQPYEKPELIDYEGWRDYVVKGATTPDEGEFPVDPDLPPDV